MNKLLLAVCAVVLLGTAPGARAGEDADGWEVTLANRQLDLTTHQARQTYTLSLTNAGQRGLSSFYVAVDSVLAGKVAYVGARVSRSLLSDRSALGCALIRITRAH